jgi:hypothetical protein
MQDTPNAAAAPRKLEISYLTIRYSIGVLGLLLPFILPIGALLIFGISELQPSVSHYYHTPMGDVFVGCLCAFGVFLFAYKGHEAGDDIAGDFAGFFAIGVALFPTAPENASPTAAIIGNIHFFFAAAFFLTLAGFSFLLFTKTDSPNAMTARKKFRNVIYRTCGIIILAAIVLIVLVKLFGPASWDAWKPVFWLEGAAIVAFGISWLVKGQAILKDLRVSTD